MFKQNFHIIAFWFGRGILTYWGPPAPACPFGEQYILIRSNNVAIVAPLILQIIWKSESSKYLPLDKEFTIPRFECFNGRGFLFTNMEDVTPKVQGVDPKCCFMYRARVGLWYQHTSSVFLLSFKS